MIEVISLDKTQQFDIDQRVNKCISIVQALWLRQPKLLVNLEAKCFSVQISLKEQHKASSYSLIYSNTIGLLKVRAHEERYTFNKNYTVQRDRIRTQDPSNINLVETVRVLLRLHQEISVNLYIIKLLRQEINPGRNMDTDFTTSCVLKKAGCYQFRNSCEMAPMK